MYILLFDVHVCVELDTQEAARACMECIGHVIMFCMHAVLLTKHACDLDHMHPAYSVLHLGHKYGKLYMRWNLHV